MKSYSLIVYFDGSCPLCSREIKWYQKRKGAENIQWRDVSKSDFNESDLSQEEALKRFHVRKCDGTLISGARAFLKLWQHISALRILGYLLTIAPIPFFLEKLYIFFLPLRARYIKKQCKTSCTIENKNDDFCS